MSTVLVTGATGNIGSHLVGELRRRGTPVRAFVRDARRARTLLGDGAEIAVGDYADRSSVAAALDGVDRVFLLTPSHPEMVTWERGFLDAAATARVRRVVKMSTIAADSGSDSRFARWQGRCEEALHASGLPAVTVRSSYHMTNVLFAAGAVRGSGRILAPVDDAKIAMIDRRDIAAVAAITLTEEGHDGRTYEVTGPEAITYHDVAAQLSQALGRPIEFIDVPEDEAVAAALRSGAPSWMAEGVVEVHRRAKRGGAAQTTEVFRVLLDREPYSFADFARDVATAF